ncbi:hypothetical protein L226DRAFT_529885 [Lentinus tigrinus ALCF2SS1-7]|uniref:Arrestin-like N-terminal domain-containing protein n=1 Tax=Lentinus tigrinus ALCF2SS1-6 TaxID=1328759 RepID=A0A5C2SVD4_9APHY|nr:hypothetical protein L227DRAFT_569693 [Lentinus tigrinus ALCF2SS1-6]RPD81487.1 hypothetical protein L226DRAFT_529885 [Lentinus tigrinus ALCF2SS1-7]
MSPPSQALTLSIPPTIFCAGSDVEGEVLLDFRQLQQENIQQVYVKLRGSVQTMVQRDKKTKRETIPLIHSSLDLWTQGSAYPPPGTDILRLPFRFRLPENLPPSFHYHTWAKSGYVLYELTAVGVRPGAFQFNRRLRMPLAVVPKDTMGGKLRDSMASLGWRKGEKVEKIRKGLWGDYSTVQVELLLPDMPVLPLFTDIPFIINVTTTTAPLTRSKADAHPENKPIFPAPPAMHTEIDFRLMRIMRIRAEHMAAESIEDVAYFLGANTIPSKLAVDTDLPPKEWVVVQPGGREKGSGEEKGVWVQRARFQTHVRLGVPPTFLSLTIECLYSLDLKVPFPGIGNDVRIDVPVTIVSGIDAPLCRAPRPISQAAALGEQGLGYAPQPPAMLDLPPAYWDVTGRGWGDLGEKD